VPSFDFVEWRFILALLADGEPHFVTPPKAAMTLSDADRRKRYLRFASTLCWVEGFFLAISCIALGVPAFVRGTSFQGAMALGLMVVAAVAFLVASQWLRGNRRDGGLLAAVGVGGNFFARIVMLRTPFSAWFALDVAILILVFMGWRLELRERSHASSARSNAEVLSNVES
jgi:cation transport ATPase